MIALTKKGVFLSSLVHALPACDGFSRVKNSLFELRENLWSMSLFTRARLDHKRQLLVETDSSMKVVSCIRTKGIFRSLLSHN